MFAPKIREGVAGNGQQPRSKLRFAAKGGRVSPKAHEHRRRQILRVLFGSEAGGKKRVHVIEMAVVKGIKSVAVSRGNRLDEVAFTDGIGCSPDTSVF